MIVTRSWLDEFVDLSSVSNETLYATFNAIGLEVGSFTQVQIPQKVVVGKIISCQRHPDADKLNVCSIDVGSGVRQIVCGAANVVDAEFVAVATMGAVLPGDFEIKHAKLRGVESEGMVCSASELGLPDLGEGIMILDESIGKLEVGKEFGSYTRVADTIIELELTPNRGDCLSIYGVARDLSAALELDMRPFEFKKAEKNKLGIAREAEIHTQGEIGADLHYKLVSMTTIINSFLMRLRLAMVAIKTQDKLAAIMTYATHATGVVLRAYDSTVFRNQNQKISILPRKKSEGIVEISNGESVFSVVGVNQLQETTANENTKELLFEASYIHPDMLVEGVASNTLKTDELYYKTSRGSNPDLEFGLSFLAVLMQNLSVSSCYDGSLSVHTPRERSAVLVNIKEINSIIGMDVEMGKVATILQKLGFEIHTSGHDVIAAHVPLFRHDIMHIQDIAEEIVRIIGINQITSKPLVFSEKARLNDTTNRFRLKKEFKNRAVGVSFYENVSFVFTDRTLLHKYDFATTKESLDLTNPITEELNTLRSTILINLLQAVKRNVSYTIKSIPLFEIGAVFGSEREQREVISFVFSGHIESENVANAGKPKMVDFVSFVQKIAAVIGEFELLPCTTNNGLLHPYQSADIVVDGKVCGFVSKLHPTVQEYFDIPVTFVAEVDFDALLPKHINATPVSKFQGVYKDLSVLVDKRVGYFEVAKILQGMTLPLLKERYPVDIYEDEKLGDKKSLTLRFFIQSADKTLEEGDIDFVMSEILSTLEKECGATLR